MAEVAAPGRRGTPVAHTAPTAVTVVTEANEQGTVPTARDE